MKTYSMRKPKKSVKKLIKEARLCDEAKIGSGTHEWIFDKMLRSMRLIKKSGNKKDI